METGKSILIMGRPGIGKTTMLREAARVLADELRKRVVVVDTSNEIAGDGDIPHPAIGKARRMQVRTPSLQHEVMIEAVENHMPEVIVIDEIGTELEAQAARTIAERGVQLIGTAHGNTLDNLMLNPTLSDLIGGIQSVTLGDEEARRRRTQKSVLERKAPPTFDVIVEIQDRERVMVHADVAETVDAMLRGDPVAPGDALARRGGRSPLAVAPQAVAARAAGPASGSRPRGRGGGALAAASPAGGARRDVPHRAGYRGRGPAAVAPGVPAGPDGRLASRPRRAERGSDRGGASGGAARPGGRRTAPLGVMPGERFAVRRRRRSSPGEIADRGPLERGRGRGAAPPRCGRAMPASCSASRRGASEAARALERVQGGRGHAAGERGRARGRRGGADRRMGRRVGLGRDGEEDDEASFGAGSLTVEGGTLPTLRVFPHGISRKRLEQAIRDAGAAGDHRPRADEADVVMTLRSEYRQKPPTLREAEDRGIPIYVLKANTIAQMQAA